MFYAESWSGILRLGDIVTGYVTAIPSHSEPIKDSFVNYNIDVRLPQYLVVLTPCCSIGEQKLALAPLLSIIDAKRKSLFKNINYKKDMTLLNQPHTLKEWQDLGEEEITAGTEDEPIYTYDHLFFYAENDILLKYSVRIRQEGAPAEEFTSGYYVVDFRNISKVSCECIAHEKEKKKNYKDLCNKMKSSKILELSYVFSSCRTQASFTQDQLNQRNK